MTTKNVLAGIPVSNLDEAVEWYTHLLNRRPDSRPMPEVAEWHFPDGAWLQLFSDVRRAGTSSTTFVESDLASRISSLDRLRIQVLSESASDLVKTAVVNDPDGNQLVFAESQAIDNPSTG